MMAHKSYRHEPLKGDPGADTTRVSVNLLNRFLNMEAAYGKFNFKCGTRWLERPCLKDGDTLFRDDRRTERPGNLSAVFGKSSLEERRVPMC